MTWSIEKYQKWWDDWQKDKPMKRLGKKRELSSGFPIEIKCNFDIPEHLIIEILSWLPVKDLLEFRSVCKLWNSIIRSKHFISMHLMNYYNSNNHWRDCLLVQYAITQAGELNVYELLMDDISKEVLSNKRIETPIYNSFICGPCDGLYFLWVFYLNPYHSLWNPALNELQLLPEMISKPNIASYMKPSYKVYGFGFDSKRNDYKVIAIEGYRDTRNDDSEIINYPLSVFIYSLKSNSWRYWGDLKNSYYLDCDTDTSYAFVNGCYYWLASNQPYDWNYEVIVSFNINTESYLEIPLPNFEKKPSYGSGMLVYRDNIAFVSVPDGNKSFSVWTWNEGVWTRVLLMDVQFEVQVPFIHWWDNMLVFKSSRGIIVMCDTNTSEMWDLGKARDQWSCICRKIVVYKESLVSIKGFMSKTQSEEAYSDVVQIPDWLWPEMCVTKELPDWLWCD